MSLADIKIVNSVAGLSQAQLHAASTFHPTMSRHRNQFQRLDAFVTSTPIQKMTPKEEVFRPLSTHLNRVHHNTIIPNPPRPTQRRQPQIPSHSNLTNPPHQTHDSKILKTSYS